MTLDEEIRNEINQQPNPPVIIDDWEEIADSLSDSFKWKGSKIDWLKTNHHQSCLYTKDDDLELLMKKFVEDHSLNKVIYSSKTIYYINDSSLDFAIAMNPEQFHAISLLVINNVPQHHYFFDENKKWCFVISSEGYIDFGFSNLS
ncbi:MULTISPECIES: hypothetical protein [Photorhabdus]|uniref:Type IV secretion protein Rhs n=1 Tax=Photorhabdus thracensis TaxID=230089 RepID=A0A0F7LNJ9_9GAMM|nr:hypothetical protein [Photorhabdus thracensis]AKH63568.1 type IV secretion protein Rhs [Photorhabdus thracensis]